MSRLVLRLGLAAFIVALGLLGALNTPLTPDIGRLLPAEGPLRDALTALRSFQVADTLVVEVDGTGVDRAALLAAVDEVGTALQESGRFRRVTWRADAADGAAIERAASPHAAALIPADTLAARLSEEGVRAALRERLAQIASPAGAMMWRRMQEDPLDLSGLALRGLRSAPGPFAVQVEDGHLLDPSGERALVVLQPADGALAAAIDDPVVATLRAVTAAAPLPARFMGGHRVAVEAAEGIAGDIHRAATLGISALLIAFLVGFRSLRPLAGAAAVLAVAGGAAAIATALRAPLHGIDLAFSGVLLGLAVDYWIHLYAAAASAEGGFRERLAAADAALASLAPALLLGAASTGLAFAVLVTSRFPVVVDLGTMGLGACLGALAGTVLVGPVAVAALGRAPFRVVHLPDAAPRRALLVVVATLAAGAYGTQARFDGDPRILTAMRPETRALESELHARYGGFGTGGMVLIEDADADRGRDRADAVQRALAQVPGLSISGATGVLPGPSTVAARRAVIPSAEVLQARIEAVAAELGLRPEALAGAADRILATAVAPDAHTWDGTALDELVSRHRSDTEGGTRWMLALVGAGPETHGAVAEVLEQTDPTARLILPAALADDGVDAIRSELLGLGAVALFGVLALLLARYRSPRALLACLMPSLAAVAWSAAAMNAAGLPWNAVSASTMVLVLGLGLDYGVFVVESRRSASADESAHAVMMSALTTLAGFGTLAVAESPALAGVGLAVMSGLGAAMVVALTVVPVVHDGVPLLGPRGRRLVASAAWLGLVGGHLDALIYLRAVVVPPEAPPTTVPTLAIVSADERRAGTGHLLRTEGVWAMYLEGEPYAMGLAHGMLTPDLRTVLEEDLERSFYRAVPNPLARFAILRGSLLVGAGLERTFRDEYLLELRGEIDASPDPHPRMGDAFTRKLFFHALHDIGQALVDSPLLACTGFMAGPGATADGHWIMGRNFDFDGGPIFDRDKVVVFRRPTEGHAFAAIGFAGMVGAVTGINDQHLAVAIQAAGTDDPPHLGPPMTLIIREILQYASSLDEAYALLDARKGFVSDAVLVIDGHAGEAALFEVSPERIGVIPVERALGVSNHFRSDVFADDATNAGRQVDSTTGHRLARVEELLETWDGAIDRDAGLAILTDRAGEGGVPLAAGHRWALDADIATHGALIDATDGTLIVSRYPNLSGGFVAFDLDAALAGDIRAVPVSEARDAAGALARHRGRDLIRAAANEPPLAAERLAREAMALMPGHPEPLQALGEALVAQGRCAEAVGPLEAALAGPPEYRHEAEHIESLLDGCR